MKKPNAVAERKPLRVVNPYVMAMILAQVDKARTDGYTADEVARHLWDASKRALQRTVTERFFVADVLTAWASQLESDARAEERMEAYARGNTAEPNGAAEFTRADGRELGIEA